jgi:hypothetical protein
MITGMAREYTLEMKFALLLGLSALLVGGAQSESPAPSPAEIGKIAERAYLFAYPLVLMEHTRRAFLEDNPENRFSHLEKFPDHTFHRVVRPNADTLYSLSWIDVAREPVVMHVPDTQGRYYLMQFLDAWTETFSIPGKRTTGTQEKWFALAGPNWQGTLPARMQRIDSPTNMVWLIGRTQTNGAADYQAVHEIQKGYVLMPLAQYPDGPKMSERVTPPKKANRKATPPPIQIAGLTPVEFFREFAGLLVQNPPHQADGPMMRDLARIGIQPGKPFAAETLGKEGVVALEGGARAASARLEKTDDPRSRTTPTGWSGMRAKVGRYGTDYEARAIVARIGLGANAPEDAVYLNCRVDADGKALDGGQLYRMHFDKGAMPPVRAFWSVTMYDQAGYFVENPIQRFAIGDRDALKYNADGSLDLYIGHQVEGSRQANWLPAPTGSFNLSFRLYWPKEEILKGEWIPPAVKVER